MAINLNRIQRGICVAAAAAVAIGILLQAQDQGLGETHWIIGSVVVSSLLILASTAPSNTAASAPAKKMPPTIDILQHYDSAYERFLAFVEDYARRLENEIGLPAPSPLNDTRALLAANFQSMASKAAYMLVFLSAQQRDAEFATSALQEALERRAVNKFVQTLSIALAKIKTAEPPRTLAIRAAAKEFAQCKVAINLSIGAFATGAGPPMDPVYQVIDSGLGLAKGRKVSLETMYGDVTREIWKKMRA